MRKYRIFSDSLSVIRTNGGSRIHVSARDSQEMLQQKEAIRDALRPQLGQRLSYRRIASEEDRVDGIFSALKSSGVVRHTEAVNIRRGDYGEIDPPEGRPWVEKAKRRESAGRIISMMVISKNVTDFLFDMANLRKGRVIDLDAKLTVLLERDEIEACVAREDFHNKKETMVKKGVASMLTSGAMMGGAVGVFLTTIGNVHQLIEEVWNLSGPRFGYAVATFAGAAAIRSLSAFRINRFWEKRADNHAAHHVGVEATSSMLLKTQIALDISREGRVRKAVSGTDKQGESRTMEVVHRALGTQPRIEQRIESIYRHSA